MATEGVGVVSDDGQMTEKGVQVVFLTATLPPSKERTLFLLELNREIATHFSFSPPNVSVRVHNLTARF